MYAIIGTWKMSFDGVSQAHQQLASGAAAGDAVQHAIMSVEDNPAYTSVGYGGLPDHDGHVMTDAAYMDGHTLRFGAVLSAENIQNPIRAARLLYGRETNCVLAGRGAELFAMEKGLPMRDMRTENAMKQWREALQQENRKLDAYHEHDTVCVLALDEKGSLIAGTSTSGLFLKQPGRVGGGPRIGSGFYCDQRYGAAAATGLGEDIMRGCLSYEIVSQMRAGLSPQKACENAVRALSGRKMDLGEDAGSISVIALAPDGAYGAATTLPVFPFVAGTPHGVAIYAASPDPVGGMAIRRTTAAEMAKEP